MPTIEKRPKSWRVKTYADGKFLSRSFKTEDEARQYAQMVDKKMVRGINSQKRLLKDHRIINYLPARFLKAVEKANYSVDEIVLCAMPATNMAGIYFLVRDLKVKYVGQTINIFHRLAQHKRDGKNFDSYSFIPCEKEHLNELERVYIDLLMPDDNKY